MILSLMKCKICGKVISPPDQALIIGESAPARNARILHALFSHIQTKRQEEANQPHQPHNEALNEAVTAGENLKGALLVGCFEIGAEQEAERQDVLRRVHEITRTVRFSDEEIQNLVGLDEYEDELDKMYDLRDRYEGLGKYAPVTQNAPEAETVKP